MKKAKKVLVVLLVVGMIAALGIQTASADWLYNVKVNSAGQASGTSFILLSDGTSAAAWGPTWFYADPAGGNQMLAAALTAVSTGSQVTVFVDSNTSLSTIRTLCCNSQ